MVKLIEGKYETAKELYSSSCSDYFEFNFTYTSMNETFREINRFLWESRHDKTRFCNRYAGDVLINLTSWNDMNLNEYFDAFMYFLKDNRDLRVTFLIEKKCTKEMLGKLEYFFSIEKTDLMLDNPKTMKRSIGFTVPESGKENGNVRI